MTVEFETLKIGQLFYIEIGFRSEKLRKTSPEYAENVNSYLKIGKCCLVQPVTKHPKASQITKQ